MRSLGLHHHLMALVSQCGRCILASSFNVVISLSSYQGGNWDNLGSEQPTLTHNTTISDDFIYSGLYIYIKRKAAYMIKLPSFFFFLSHVYTSLFCNQLKCAVINTFVAFTYTIINWNTVKKIKNKTTVLFKIRVKNQLCKFCMKK